jgi:hypothetical protein
MKLFFIPYDVDKKNIKNELMSDFFFLVSCYIYVINVVDCIYTQINTPSILFYLSLASSKLN